LDFDVQIAETEVMSPAVLPAMGNCSRERTMSVRLLWPFLRAAGPAAPATSILARHGIHALQLVRLDSRVACRAALAALDSYVAATGDRAIGARAGASVESADLDVVEFAARSCRDVREAIASCARHVRLLHDDAEIVLVEEGGMGATARCVLRTVEGRAAMPAASAFAVVAAATFLRRITGVTCVAREMHLRAKSPRHVGPDTHAVASTIRFGMPDDALVFEPWQLDMPTLHPQPWLGEAFEAYADELSSDLQSGFRRRVRAVAASELRSARLSMSSAAAAVGVSPSTLRRRLLEERTTFREIVDEVRCELAVRYLLDPRWSIGAISAQLGFSYVAAFNKAFRRWKGVSPSEHRAALG
jgi:AraC-like DNA-binding protein